MSTEEQIDERAAWVERHIKRTLTDFQRRAVVLLCQARRAGPYDFARTFETAEWGWGNGVRFVVERPSLATYDADGLTALVIGAHDQAIRVEIDPRSFTHLTIAMWPRQREHKHQWGRHPTIEQAVARYRGNLDATGRTPTDYALEHAEYLAKAAESLLTRMHVVAAAEQRIEDDDSDGSMVEYEQALEHQGEAMSRLLGRIYEFRKRRDRAQEAAQ